MSLKRRDYISSCFALRGTFSVRVREDLSGSGRDVLCEQRGDEREEREG